MSNNIRVFGLEGFADPANVESIGALFALYGAGVLATGLFRRQQGNRQFFQVRTPQSAAFREGSPSMLTVVDVFVGVGRGWAES